MTYKIREKFWSWGDTYTITDENGTERFLVKGKVFSWGDKLSFQDLEGRELAFIRQELFSFLPFYQILINGEVYAELKQEFTWFRPKFTLDIPGPNDYTITGSFLEHEYRFERGGQTVAEISKAWFSWTDSYGIRISEGEDVTAVLCTCIIIDQILDKKKD